MGNEKPKVAIVYPYFAHYRTAIINELLESKEYDFYFIGDTKTSALANSQKLHSFDQSDRFLKVDNYWFFKYFLWQRRLKTHINTHNFDSVIFLGDWKYVSTGVAVLYLKIKKTPSLFWSHGIMSSNKSFSNKLKLWFLKMFSHGGFVYSNYAKKNMLDLGFKAKIEVIYNSLDFKKQIQVLDSIEKLHSNDELTIRKPYVILSGRLEARKDIEILFDAVNYLKRNKEKINVVLVGDGVHKAFLMNYAKELDILDEVLFYGSCYDELKLAELYVNSLVCVIPNAVGLSAIHSLTYRTPVITSDDITSHGPEIEAVIHNKTGRYFEKKNYKSLAEQILYFKNMSEDESNNFRISCSKIVKEKYNPVVQHQIISSRLDEYLTDNYH